MKLLLAHLAVFVAAIGAQSTLSGSSCGMKPNEDQMAVQRAVAAAERSAPPAAGDAAMAISVDTWFHVVAKSTEAKDGWISDEHLHAQVAQINRDYAPSNISFTLAGINRIVNASWSTWVPWDSSPATSLEMGQALRKGNYSTLNIYFVTNMTAPNLLGWCNYPCANCDKGRKLAQDGCVVMYDTVPGGSRSNANTGKMATHEIGHWFHLFHTFENGCSGDGDFVDDTPYVARPNFGCPQGVESCGEACLKHTIQESLCGPDPIHNYMDYTDE
ncbi:hypothetical protein CDD81_1858 [Ophiocordyceps australis]|uniref:Peptidase M43 pregnancy-associated plasma-A domain-containing protein n=1 Tax=Ophiocordyceps australis TaxID=1399860 RepID=A0A2C5XY30_9HYPO|nr:hypothetical protein CDD81_1858 [Ophiocordyceps australis]